MKLAILHYHLNRGGVTQVISNHLRALNETAPDGEPTQIIIVHGGRCEDWDTELPSKLPHLTVQLREIPCLDYDDGVPRPDQLAQELVLALSQAGFSGDNTVVHVHNHALGKNVSLPGALVQLVGRGFRCLLQIHDFAEDFRPDNYGRLVDALAPSDPQRLASILYPQASSIHYAVLNGRDHQLLEEAGFDGERLHRLPNPVAPIGPLPSRVAARDQLNRKCGVSTDRRLLLYPVRGIRRKNVGECLLWAALAREQATLAITLPPLNRFESARYQAWKQLSQRLGLPLAFDVGAPGGLRLRENLGAADAILTTSVAEGFGMVFLESWLAGRPLVGRDLPEITADFVSAGLQLDGLSPRLAIPVPWLGAQRIRTTILRAFSNVRRAYHHPTPSDEDLRLRIDSLISNELVDFAILSNELQQQTIELVHRDAVRGAEVRRLNPLLERAFSADPADSQIVRHNADAVTSNYSLEATGQRLRNLYHRILDSQSSGRVTDPSDGEHLLRAFLDVARIHPIRIES